MFKIVVDLGTFVQSVHSVCLFGLFGSFSAERREQNLVVILVALLF